MKVFNVFDQLGYQIDTIEVDDERQAIIEAKWIDQAAAIQEVQPRLQLHHYKADGTRINMTVPGRDD